jgi:DNA-binding response OmpR family regulator
MDERCMLSFLALLFAESQTDVVPSQGRSTIRSGCCGALVGRRARDREDTMWRILVVDDQDCIRSLITETLTADGYEIRSIGDAQSVKGILLSDPPDLILLDLYLDGPQGFDLLQEIKDKCPNLPVIILTAYDSHREDPGLAGADGYIVKSVDFGDDLSRTIADVLRRNQSLQPKTAGEMDSAGLPANGMHTCKMMWEGSY